MATRTVTGTLYHLDGTAWENGVVKFALVEPFQTATETYPKEEHSETADSNGAISITLGVPDTGTAKYRIELPDGKKYIVYLASGAATTLESLLTIAGSAVAQDAVQTIVDANNVLSITHVTTTYVVLDSDDVVLCDGTFTVTLPPATGSGATYVIRNIGSGDITLAADGTDTINGDGTIAIISGYWNGVIDCADGVWYI